MNMLDDVEQRDHVERVRGERERFGAARDEPRVRREAARVAERAVRHIDADRVGAACGLRREPRVAAADVEQPRAQIERRGGQLRQLEDDLRAKLVFDAIVPALAPVVRRGVLSLLEPGLQGRSAHLSFIP